MNAINTVKLGRSGMPERRQVLPADAPRRSERIVFGAAFMAALFVVWQSVTALGLEPPIILAVA